MSPRLTPRRAPTAPSLRARTALVLLALTAPLSLALPAAASADTRIAAKSVTDATGGATVTAELWRRSSDGAVYPKVNLRDTRADGICAHGSVNWKHRNGNSYFDTGMWVCGAGAARLFSKGARNWRDYASVSISASVDNGPVASVHLIDFPDSAPSPAPPSEPRRLSAPPIVRDPDGCDPLRQGQQRSATFTGVRRGIGATRERQPGVPYYPEEQLFHEAFRIGKIELVGHTCRILRGPNRGRWGLISPINLKQSSVGLTAEGQTRGGRLGEGWGLGIADRPKGRPRNVLTVRLMNCETRSWKTLAELIGVPVPGIKLWLDVTRWGVAKLLPEDKVRCADFGTYELTLLVDQAGTLVLEAGPDHTKVGKRPIDRDAREEWTVSPPEIAGTS